MNRHHGGNIWEISKKYSIPVEDIIDFSASINPLGPPKGIKKKINSSLDFMAAYPDPESSELKEELARYHGIPVENILLGNGSTELLYLLPRALGMNRVLVVEPSFSEYENSLEAACCKVDSFITREEDGFEPKVNLLFSILKDGYDALYLCNPGNPAGTFFVKNKVITIAEECQRFNTLLILDEAFIDFVEEESIKKEVIELNNTVVIRSMTKFFAIPGLRVGYIITSRGIIDRLRPYRHPWAINIPAMMAGIEALRNRSFREKTLRWMHKEKKFLFSGLKEIRWLKPFSSSVNFFLLKILSRNLTAPLLQEVLIRRGILIRDCSSFIGLGNKYFRVAVKKRKGNRLLIEELKGAGNSMMNLSF